VADFVRRLLTDDTAVSPSRLYVMLLRHGIEQGWDLSRLDLCSVTEQLRAAELDIDRRSALVVPAVGP